MVLFICITAGAQNTKFKVAVTINMDTTFTVYDFFGTKSFDVNLSKDLYSMICYNIDTTKYDVNYENTPQNIKEKNGYIGYKKEPFLTWLNEIRENKGYKLLIVLSKPMIHPMSPFFHLSGYSYGMTTGRNDVFSMNIGSILDTRDGKYLVGYGMHASSEFIMRLEKKDRFIKTLDQYTLNDISKSITLIKALNESFAKNICMKMNLAREKQLNR